MNQLGSRKPRIVFCDVETTGLGTAAEVVEAAVLDIHGVPIFNSLIRPSDPYGYIAEEIHGIGARQLADARPFKELANDLYWALNESILVCHNVEFDAGMILAAFSASGLSAPVPDATVCTMTMAASLLRPGGRISLTSAMDALSVELPYGQPHRARFDAECTRLLWASLHASGVTQQLCHS